MILQGLEVKTNVTKLVIVPYTDKNFQEVKKDDAYVLPVNPETYQQNYKIAYDNRQGQGQQRTDPRYIATTPEELKLEFTLDGTGTIEGYHNPDELTVQEQFLNLRKTVYDMQGNIHRPYWVKIFWGELKFQGLLTQLDINYTLFDPDGKPLRAKVSMTFMDYIAQEERVREENKESPDLTQVRKIKANDRLDLMTYEAYDSPEFVRQVAYANNLTSFRKLKSGQDLVFPPFDKTEK